MKVVWGGRLTEKLSSPSLVFGCPKSAKNRQVSIEVGEVEAAHFLNTCAGL